MNEVIKTCNKYNIPQDVMFTGFKQFYNSVKINKLGEVSYKQFGALANLTKLVGINLKYTE